MVATIGDLLVRTARVYPSKLGVKDKLGKYTAIDTEYTWQELNERVNRLANSLLALGLQPQDRVAVYSDTRSQFIIIYFAIMKAGMVMVPINTAYRGAELRYLVENSAARAIFVDADKAPLLTDAASGLASLEYVIGIGSPHGLPYSFEALVAAGEPHEPTVALDDKALATLLYTSGTTGRPKGAMLTHRNWCASAYITAQEWRLLPHYKFLCVLAPFFTGGIAFMTLAAARGFSLVMSDFEPRKVLEIIEKEKIDYTMFVPTMTSRLVKFPEVHRFNLSSLKHVITSGAPISEALVREACEVLFGGELRFVFTYGTSETAVGGCQLQPEEVSLDGPASRRLTSVGKAMLGMQVTVVDEHGKEVEPGSGQVGEVIVKGDTVGIGYWGLPENKELKEGTWRSGDLARVDEDGYIYIVDRKKDMILTGGANVYPREVEDVLSAHPAVMHCAVIGIPDPEWGERVHAVVVLREGASATQEEIIAFCKQQLASYKCPKSVEFLSLTDLPINPSGKILKRELRQRYWQGYERKGEV